MPGQRIVVADERLLMLEGLRRILESEFEVVAAVQDGRTLVTVVENTHPDLVLTDIALPLLSGVEAVSRIKRSNPEVRAVFLIGGQDNTILSAAIKSGAAGYLVKDCSASELLAALREVSAGRSYITPLLTEELLSKLRATTSDTRAETLTDRQREILQLIAEGYQLKEIAGMLNISHKTVEYHKYALMQALGLRSTTQLVKYALQNRMYTDSAAETPKIKVRQQSNSE